MTWPSSWPKWRTIEYDYVRERDDDLCVITGQAGSEIHHVDGRVGAPKKVHHRSNMVVMSWDCHHNRAHGAEKQEIKAQCIAYLKEVGDDPTS